MSSNARASAARSPRSAAIVTGKNVRYVEMIATESQPRVVATTMIGEMARIGTVCDATTYGTKARSAAGSGRSRWPGRARARPPSDEPDERFAEREQRLAGEEQAERRPVALRRVDERRDDVPEVRQRQVVGQPQREWRRVLVADGQAGDSAGIRHGSPASHLNPSQTARRRSPGPATRRCAGRGDVRRRVRAAASAGAPVRSPSRAQPATA